MRAVWLGARPNSGCAVAECWKRSGLPVPHAAARGLRRSAPSGRSNSEPIVVGGLTYYPTRGFRLFDGQVMAQAGMYERRAGLRRHDARAVQRAVRAARAAAGCASTSAAATASSPGTTGSHAPTFPSREPIRSSAAPDGAVTSRPRSGRHRRNVRPACASDSAAISPHRDRHASHVDHHGRAARAATPTASGWSSTARAGTATGRRCRSRPIASSRLAQYQRVPGLPRQDPAAATTSGWRW